MLRLTRQIRKRLIRDHASDEQFRVGPCRGSGVKGNMTIVRLLGTLRCRGLTDDLPGVLEPVKYPITLSDSTPYYEKHFLTCDVSPHAYVSAFREAQYDAQRKRRIGSGIFWIVSFLTIAAWLTGFLNIIVAPMIVAAVWALVSWRNRHEAKLLARTFELALRGKEREFHEYMWRHLDRRMLRQDF